MSTDIVKYAFIAGEISPTLFGRTDLTKYDLAMAEAQNFFVDYRGGLSSRPGFEFTDFVKLDNFITRMFTFNFNPEVSNTYVVLFGHGYIRFIQDGAYVLEASKVITGATKTNPVVLTVAAHGLATGRWVKVSGVAGMTQLNGRTYEVRNPTVNTFELFSVPDLVAVNGTAYGVWAGGGIIEAIYEIASLYTGVDLAGLSVKQYRDLLRITSSDFPIYNLTREDHIDWTLVAEVIHDFELGPTITSQTQSAAGSARTIFSITKILEDGTESLGGLKFSVAGVINYIATEGSISVYWSPVADAREYNVYRSIVSSSEVLSSGSELGYVGRTKGTKFTDPNIIADFGKAPPLNYNPFAPGAVTSIEVTNGGSGYATFTTLVSIDDPTGSGFIGEVVIDDGGVVVNIIVKSGGKNYTAPVVEFSAGGSNATATASIRALTGTNPALSAIYQQRQIYAASNEMPIRPIHRSVGAAATAD